MRTMKNRGVPGERSELCVVFVFDTPSQRDESYTIFSTSCSSLLKEVSINLGCNHVTGFEKLP